MTLCARYTPRSPGRRDARLSPWPAARHDSEYWPRRVCCPESVTWADQPQAASPASTSLTPQEARPIMLRDVPRPPPSPWYSRHVWSRELSTGGGHGRPPVEARNASLSRGPFCSLPIRAGWPDGSSLSLESPRCTGSLAAASQRTLARPSRPSVGHRNSHTPCGWGHGAPARSPRPPAIAASPPGRRIAENSHPTTARLNNAQKRGGGLHGLPSVHPVRFGAPSLPGLRCRRWIEAAGI